MNWLSWGLLLVAVLFFVYKDIQTKAESKSPTIKNLTYEMVPILTNHELKNYRILKIYTDKHSYTINVKVRLADLINPTKTANKKEWYRNFMKIASKHVDFVVCDTDMNVQLIIELDDWSHDRQDRKNRDQFVDAALTGAGLKVIHTREITPESLEKIDSIINPIVPKIEHENPTYEEWKAAKNKDQIISPTGWIYNKETQLWDPPKSG